MNNLLLILALLIFAICFESVSRAEVYMKRDEALKSAFPEADNIEKINVFLTQNQVKEIEALSKTKLDSRFYVIYEGKRGAQTLGYAIIDTHSLRTQSETVMYVINTDGTLRYGEVLAFFEPPEYIGSEKWMNLFRGKGLEEHALRLGSDIPNMTGATITAVAYTNAARRVLGVFAIANSQGLLLSEAGN